MQIEVKDPEIDVAPEEQAQQPAETSQPVKESYHSEYLG